MFIEQPQEAPHGLRERIVGVADFAMGAVMLTRKNHTEWDRVRDLSEYDLERYTNLIRAYRESFPETNELPEFWALKGNKPCAEINFEETGLRLKAEAVALNTRNAYDHDVRATILTHIGDLFISISKRSIIGDMLIRGTAQVVRSDGVEVMLYTHLADWLLCTAPKFEPDNRATVDKYRQILNFYSTIELTVVTDQPSEAKRNNPNSTLRRIIKSFDHYYKNLENFHHAKRFDGLVKQLNNNVLGLASSVLDALYLLIDGVTDDALIVDKFTSPDQTTRNHAAARETVLGEFLYLTLSKAGIIHSTYNSKNTLTIQAIEEHLCADTIRQNKSGHRPFSTKADANYSDGRIKSAMYLEEMRQLNRLILELYYLSQTLIQSSAPSRLLTGSWVYDNQAEKAALLELLLSTKEVTDDLYTTFNNFWTMYYTKDFAQYVTNTHANTLSEEHKPIVHIDTTITRNISTGYRAIGLCINELQIEAKKYSIHEENVQKARVSYIKQVLEHRQYRHREDTENYRIAAQELEHLTHPETLVRVALPAPRARKDELQERDSTIVDKDITLRNQEQEIKHLKARLLQVEEALASEKTQQNAQARQHRNPYNVHPQRSLQEEHSREHANVPIPRIDRTYVALSTSALSQLDYHWLWGLRRVPHGQGNIQEAVQLLREHLETQQNIALQMQAIWRLPWLVRALYWLFNINNYCLHYNLLQCYLALELYEATIHQIENHPNRGHQVSDHLAHIDDKEVLIVGGFFLAGLATWAMLKRYGCEPFIAEHLEYFSQSICSIFGDIERYEIQGSRSEQTPLLAMAETCATNIANYEALISSAEDILVNEAMLEHLEILGFTKAVGEHLSLKEIEQAYKNKAKQTHPDKPGGNQYDFIAVKDARNELIKMISLAEGPELTLYKSMLAYERRLASLVTNYPTLEREIKAYNQGVDAYGAQVDEAKAIGERVQALLTARFERTKLKQKEYYEQESNDIASRMEQGTLNLSSHRYSLHKSFSTGLLPEKDDNNQATWHQRHGSF